jgi:hypothetical protein
MPTTMPSLGEMGGGLPGAAGGLSGLASQLADALGGLFERPVDALPNPPDVEHMLDVNDVNDVNDVGDEPAPDDEELVPDDEESAPVQDREDESDTETDDLAAAAGSADPSVDACAESAVDHVQPPEPVATPPPAPMPPPPQPIVEPAPSAEPVGAETLCEIAADELPQAGP